MVNFQFFQSCLSASYYCEKTNFYIVLNVQEALIICRICSAQEILPGNLESDCLLFTRARVAAAVLAVCSPASLGRAPAAEGCLAALCRSGSAWGVFPSCFEPVLSLRPRSRCRALLHVSMGCVCRLTGVGARIHCAVPAGKAASPG